VSTYICYEKDGEYICESDREIELRNLVERLLEKISEELEIEIEQVEPGKFKGGLKHKKKQVI
jgi:hypothetical protein